MKTILLTIALATAANAQVVATNDSVSAPNSTPISQVSATPVKAAVPPPEPPDPLPNFTVGFGPSWTRGGSSPYGLDFSVGIRIAKTKFFSYTLVSTPIAFPIVPGAPPAVSTFTTGGMWVPVQTANGAVSLIFVASGGFSAVQANSTVTPAFTGQMAVAFRLGKSPVYVMPYFKAANATTSPTSGALATAVLQPGVQIVYGFWSGK